MYLRFKILHLDITSLTVSVAEFCHDKVHNVLIDLTVIRTSKTREALHLLLNPDARGPVPQDLRVVHPGLADDLHMAGLLILILQLCSSISNQTLDGVFNQIKYIFSSSYNLIMDLCL